MAGIAPEQLLTAARVRVAPSTRGPAASPDSQLPERDRRRPDLLAGTVKPGEASKAG